MNSLLKKSIAGFVAFTCCLFLALSVFPGVADSHLSEKDIADVKNLSADFIQHHFSDTAPPTDGVNHYLANDADHLRTFMAMRKEIKVRSTISDLTLEHFNIQEIDITKVAPGTLDVHIETLEENMDTERGAITQSRVNAYRLQFVQENSAWKIQKAIADDYTGVAFYPDIIANPEAFRAYSMDRFEEDIDRVALEDVCRAATETKLQVQKDIDYYNANEKEMRANAEAVEKRLVQEKIAGPQAA